MLKTDLLDVFEAVTDERLSEIKIEWEEGACVCVVLSSGGYPVKYEKGKEISIGDVDKDVILCHAGTKRKDGKLVTDGGTGSGRVRQGRERLRRRGEKAYRNVEKIRFEGMHYRRDIGVKYRDEPRE